MSQTLSLCLSFSCFYLLCSYLGYSMVRAWFIAVSEGREQVRLASKGGV